VVFIDKSQFDKLLISLKLLVMVAAHLVTF